MLDVAEEYQGVYDMDDFMNMYSEQLKYSGNLKLPNYDNIYGHAQSSNPDHISRFNEEFLNAL